MPARDVIHYSRSPALTNLMHGQVPATILKLLWLTLLSICIHPNGWDHYLWPEVAIQLTVREICTLTHAYCVVTRTRFFFLKRVSCGKLDDHLGEWNKLMYSDCRGRLEHKGSFGLVQNAESIVQVACFFSPRHPMRKIKPSYIIFNIYRHACKNSHVVIISFLFTVHYR